MKVSRAQIAEKHLQDRLRGKEEVKLLTLKVIELPMLSAVINRILKVTGGSHFGSMDMARVISTNRFLAGSILKVANSPCFGLSQDVPEIQRAIGVLGFEGVRSIALSASVMEMFGTDAARNSFDRERFWIHSLACAYLSKRIAAMTHRAEIEMTFVCAVLHDIGKVVLAMCFPGSYRKMLERVAAEELSLAQGEYEMLGFNHAEVGMWLAQRWRFPKAVVFTIANHHGMIAEDERYNSLVAILRLADHLCLAEKICLEEQVFVEPLEDSIMEILKLHHDDLMELRHTLAARKDAFKSLLCG